jgi:hypothetical protein
LSSHDKDQHGPAVVVESQRVGDGGTGIRFEIGHGPAPRYSTLPNYSGSARFSGRVKDLDVIAEAFADPTRPGVLVLHGKPGVGKSRLAVEYAKTHQARYPGGTFFVSLDLTPPTDLAKLLDLFGLERRAGESIEDQCQRALALLGHQPTLLIYDNVTGEDVLSDWLPPEGLACHVLATSTAAYWPAARSTHEVPLLNDDDGRELVYNVVRDKAAAGAWVDRLLSSAQGITVELCAAASAIDHQTQRRRPGSLGDSLAKDTLSSFDRAWRSLPEDAKLVLRSASLFETTRIPPAALLALWIGEGWPEARFDDALDAALDRTLIARKSEVLDMHQCVARFVDKQSSPTLSDALRRRHFDGFLQAAARFFEHPANPQLGAALRAYPASPTFWSARLPVRSAKLADEAHTVGEGLRMDGRFDEAREWFELAVAAKEKGDVHGRVDPESLGLSLHLVGYCYANTGHYDEARGWFERAVAEAGKGDVHGRVDHASLGSSLNLVGCCYAVSPLQPA